MKINGISLERGREPTSDFNEIIVSKCLINGNNNIVPIRVANPNNNVITF